jgi:hypothetical protein
MVGFDRDVLDADMLLMVLVGDDGRHVELHAVQAELAAAVGNFRFTVAPKFVNVELPDLLRILSGPDVDVPELHGHARLRVARDLYYIEHWSPWLDLKILLKTVGNSCLA